MAIKEDKVSNIIERATSESISALKYKSLAKEEQIGTSNQVSESKGYAVNLSTSEHPKTSTLVMDRRKGIFDQSMMTPIKYDYNKRHYAMQEISPEKRSNNEFKKIIKDKNSENKKTASKVPLIQTSSSGVDQMAPVSEEARTLIVSIDGEPISLEKEKDHENESRMVSNRTLTFKGIVRTSVPKKKDKYLTVSHLDAAKLGIQAYKARLVKQKEEIGKIELIDYYNKLNLERSDLKVVDSEKEEGKSQRTVWDGGMDTAGLRRSQRLISKVN